MAFNRILSLSLGFAALAAISVGLPACSGDDDDVASPTPTPANPDYCVLEWQSDGGGDTINVYRLIMTADLWDGPSNAYSATPASANVLAVAAYRVPLTTPAGTSIIQAATLATAPSTGTFETTAVGVEQDNAFTFDDTVPQSFAILTTAFTLGATQGSAGIGHFDGVWSEFDTTAPNATLGNGNITIMGTNGQAVTIGGANAASFGICKYLSGAFAPRAVWEEATKFSLKR